MQSYDFGRRSVCEPSVSEPSHLKSFNAARQRLVEQRHALIKALATSHQAEQSEAHIDLIIRVQKAIEVVDKAIGEDQPVPRSA